MEPQEQWALVSNQGFLKTIRQLRDEQWGDKNKYLLATDNVTATNKHEIAKTGLQGNSENKGH
jgi:hypothetical protein